MTIKQNAIDVINTYMYNEVEYETTHKDSGEDYSFLVKESWNNRSTVDLLWSLKQLSDVDSRYKYLDTDTLIDIALESFTMESGSIFGSLSGGISLGSFPVGEVEVCLSEVELPEGITLDDIESDCDCYISGTSYGYAYTDSVWFAILDIPTFNQLIDQHFEL